MEMKTRNLNGVWYIKNEDQRVKRWKSFSYKHVYESEVKNWRDRFGQRIETVDLLEELG